LSEKEYDKSLRKVVNDNLRLLEMIIKDEQIGNSAISNFLNGATEKLFDYINDELYPREMIKINELIEGVLDILSKYFTIQKITDSERSDYLDKIFPKNNNTLYEFYGNAKNPYFFDMEGSHKRKQYYSTIIQDGIRNGNDAVVIKNTYDGGHALTDVVILFNPNQVKSVYNKGTFSTNTNNFFEQEDKDKAKAAAKKIANGTFRIVDGDAIISIAKAKNISTLAHENFPSLHSIIR
jgi:hypothetical protein